MRNADLNLLNQVLRRRSFSMSSAVVMGSSIVKPNMDSSNPKRFKLLFGSESEEGLAAQFEEDSSSTSSPPDYDHIDKILDRYEKAASEESTYLLSSSYPMDIYHISCGLSPARTFSPSILLRHYRQSLRKISFGLYEWTMFINLIRERKRDFFDENQDQYPDEYEPVEFKCGDYIKVSQVFFEDVKALEIEKRGVGILLFECELDEILRLDSNLISHRLIMLDRLNFCLYYHNILDLVKKWQYESHSLTAKELLMGFCDASNFSLLSTALREYMYYYEDNVLKDINK